MTGVPAPLGVTAGRTGIRGVRFIDPSLKSLLLEGRLTPVERPFENPDRSQLSFLKDKLQQVLVARRGLA
jgi:hypothetical protein